MEFYKSFKRTVTTINDAISDLSNEIIKEQFRFMPDDVKICKLKREKSRYRNRLQVLIAKYDRHLEKYLKGHLSDLSAKAIRSDFAKKRGSYKTKHNSKYISYIRRAAARKMEFELDEKIFDEILAAECHYCGDSGGTIDRVDSKKGYSIKNVVPCCLKCNLMKNKYTHIDFIKKKKKIHDKQCVYDS